MASLVEQNEGQGENSVGLALVWPLSGLSLSSLGLALVRIRFGIWSVLGWAGQALLGPWLGLFDRGNLLWKSNV